MRIRVSYNWLKEYVKIKKSAEEAAEVLSLHSQTADKVLPDAVWEVEVTTNRPDCLSVIGLGRELAAAMKTKFCAPIVKLIKSKSSSRKLKVQIKSPGLCSRYQGLVMEGVKVGPSPLWMQNRLQAAGLRPINNIVDITNYVMLEWGQPMHAFDYKKLVSKKENAKQILVRLAKTGEKLLALDGQEYKLTGDDLVIADEQKPIALAGIRGGEESAVSSKTDVIILESATFNPTAVRRASRRLSLISDSSLRFEKQLSIENTTPAIWRAASLIQEIAKGKVAGKIIDCQVKHYKQQAVELEWQKLEQFLGIAVAKQEVKRILTALGFQCQVQNKKIIAKIPWWREYDIEIPEDLIEEIARFYGYERFPAQLPTGELSDEERDWRMWWMQEIKNALAGLGFTEVYAYSFISQALLEKIGFSASKAMAVENPLSADFAFMRPSLIPGILQAIADNQENYPAEQIFELSRVYNPRPGDLPEENSRLAVAIYGQSPKGELFYQIKGILEFIVEKMGLTAVKIKPGAAAESDSILWQKNCSLTILIQEQVVGLLGEINPAILSKLGIKREVAILDMDWEKLVGNAARTKVYQPALPYPPVLRDLAFVLATNILHSEVLKTIKAVDPLIKEVELFDVYEGGKLGPGRKNLAYHLIFQSSERTLRAEEVDVILKKVVFLLKEKFNAEVRSW